MKKEDLDADPQSMNNRRLSSIARNPSHPLATHAKAELARRRVRRSEIGEGAMKRMVTTQSNKADRMASTDKKGLETYKKKMNEYGGPKLSADKIKKMRTPQMNVDEISLDQLRSKISNTGMKSTKKAMGADKIKKDLEAMKAKLATEEKDPNEYDNEGSMMKSQLRQICSANEKLMSMVKDDDNLPEWVQSKVTKATDYIRSVRDYLESEKMEEKTLTPAELKKREKIAKAIEKDNPDMPMDKKMAIATATAKRVAEGAYLKGSIESRADAHEDQADHHNSQAEKAQNAGDKMAASAHKAAARAHMKAASYFDKHLSKPAHLRPQAAGGATSQAAHAATQKANQYNESTELDEARGTSAKYADKSGVFGGKYTSKDHMMTMKNMQAIRKKRQDQRDAEHKKQDPKMAKKGYAKHMMDTDKADAKARKRGINPDGQYDKYKKRNNIKDSVQVDEVLDTPQAMQSYRDKNKRSKEKAANSAAAKILRGPDKDGNRADHSPELNTMRKRRDGDKLADRNAARKTLNLLRKQGQKK